MKKQLIKRIIGLTLAWILVVVFAVLGKMYVAKNWEENASAEGTETLCADSGPVRGAF